MGWAQSKTERESRRDGAHAPSNIHVNAKQSRTICGCSSINFCSGARVLLNWLHRHGRLCAGLSGHSRLAATDRLPRGVWMSWRRSRPRLFHDRPVKRLRRSHRSGAGKPTLRAFMRRNRNRLSRLRWLKTRRDDPRAANDDGNNHCGDSHAQPRTLQPQCNRPAQDSGLSRASGRLQPGLQPLLKPLRRRKPRQEPQRLFGLLH